MNLRSSIIYFTFLFILPLQVLSQNRQLELGVEYYSNNEFEKAISVFGGLAKNENNFPQIHKYYLASLIQVNALKDAQKYLKRAIKKYPDEAVFNIDYGIFLKANEDSTQAYSFLYDYVERIKRNSNQLRYAAIYLTDNKLYSIAEKCYQIGQKNNGDDFSFELAELYLAWGKADKMIEQYMGLLLRDPEQLDYVQIALQENLDQDGFDQLEIPIVRYVQKNPDKLIFNELLLWYHIQKKEFYKAFFQARAIDKRKNQEGFKILEIGKLALGNQAYDDATKIFEHLIDKYRKEVVYPIAKKLLIKSKEELVKNTYPVDIAKIKSLAEDYQSIISEIGITSGTADAVRSMALLQAFYLNNKDTAVVILENLIARRGIPRHLLSQAKLDLGDIFLLKDEPWEASLLYSQVEKVEKDQQLGHIAKLKNAKLSYYKGEFELAKAHLDILKLATSREIANDAMDLSLLIQDNLNLDTTETNMQNFAAIELLAFQGKYEEALGEYDRLLSLLDGHSLVDEIIWEKANLLIKLGRFERAIDGLKKILEGYKEDILADDANYTIGKIYEENLKNPEKAMEFYKQQLLDFPGSVYNVDARKRFRTLRGDNVN